MVGAKLALLAGAGSPRNELRELSNRYHHLRSSDHRQPLSPRIRLSFMTTQNFTDTRQIYPGPRQHRATGLTTSTEYVRCVA
jgi:hypothetical protein